MKKEEIKLHFPIIEAQEMCKIAMIEAGKNIILFYTTLKEKELIEDFTYRLLPYNQGYMFIFTVKKDWKKLDEMVVSDEIKNFIYNSSTHIYMQPCNFYEERINDSVTPAYFESTMIKLNKDQEEFIRYIEKDYISLEVLRTDYVECTLLRINEFLRSL